MYLKFQWKKTATNPKEHYTIYTRNTNVIKWLFKASNFDVKTHKNMLLPDDTLLFYLATVMEDLPVIGSDNSWTTYDV